MTAPLLAHVGREASALIHAFEVAVEEYITADLRRFDALAKARTTAAEYDVLKRRTEAARAKRDAARTELVNLVFRNEREVKP